MKTKYPISVKDSQVSQFKEIMHKEISYENYLGCIYQNFLLVT